MDKNSKSKYFSFVGSYEGLIKTCCGWTAVKELNRINKDGWIRWQGPMSNSMSKAWNQRSSLIPAVELYPERATI